MTNKITGDLQVTGHLRSGSMTVPSAAVTNESVATQANIARSKLAQDTVQSQPIPLTDFRVHDAVATVLPGTSSADDLGLDSGTFGTSGITIRTSDLKTAGATTRYARCQVALPLEYDDNETVNVRVYAGMITTVADTSCTVDVECYSSDKDTTMSADLCSTAAQSINSLVFAAYDFTIDASSLESGDLLDIRIAIACNDAASGTAVIAAITSVELMVDIRG